MAARLGADVDGGAADGDDAGEVVVVAANRLSRAASPGDTNCSEGAASQPNGLSIQGGGSDAGQEARGYSLRAVAGVSGLTALDGTSAARRFSPGLQRSGRSEGHGKGQGKGDGGSGDTGEHCEV